MASYLFSFPVKLAAGITVGTVVAVGFIGAVIDLFNPLGEVYR
jgi:hypothetical protein